MKFGTCYCTYSSNVFQTKMRKRRKEKRKKKWKKERKWKRETRRWEVRRQETAHTTKKLRHRRAPVLVADAVRGGPKFPGGGEGRGTGISRLKGKHCSCRLQHYNMPALKEIKEIKRSIWVSRSCRADSYPG